MAVFTTVNSHCLKKEYPEIYEIAKFWRKNNAR